MSSRVQQIYGAKMKVRLVLGLMLFTGLLVVGCGGESEQQPQVDLDPIVIITDSNISEAAIKATLEAALESSLTSPTPIPTPTSTSATPSEKSDLLAQALKENADLKARRFDLLQEVNAPLLFHQPFFVSAEELKTLREQLKALRESENPFTIENLSTENPYTEFLKNEINRLLSEIKRLENLGLPYDYDFPESGFPMERKEVVLALAEGLRSSIVTVQAGGGVGTGFVIGNDLIVTNEHVISGIGTVHRAEVISGIVVTTFGGEEFNAETVGYDKVWDVELIRTEAPLRTPVLTWGDSRKLQNGNPLFAIGHPAQMGNWALTAGVFVKSETILLTPLRENYDTDAKFEAALAAEREGDPGTSTNLKTTVPGMIGSSGSPIFNVDGEVIAVLMGSTSIELIPETTDPDPSSTGASFNIPMPHIMHSVPVRVSREWTVGSPAWKVEELIAKWLVVKP